MRRSGRPRSRDRSTGLPEVRRLVVDAMLGSLARKLRATGFDTVYYAAGDDDGALRLCRRQRRALVTADRALASSAVHKGVSSLLVGGRDDTARVSSMVQAANLAGLRLLPGAPRCSACNGRLSSRKVNDVRGELPSSVAALHREFYSCSRCGQLYWKGSHWKKLRSIRRLLAAN